MKKSITLSGYCLLLISGYALADRPAMIDQSEIIEPEFETISDSELEPVLEEVSPVVEDVVIPEVTPDIEPAPVLEDVSLEEVSMEEVSLENITEEDISAVEVEMQQEAAEPEPVEVIDELEVVEETEEPKPVIHVYDHNTETEITKPRTQTTGDVVELQSGETIPVKVVAFPSRGMSMEKVRNELGEPVTISETVGEPPITSWIYNDRTVYFEYSRVLHVVASH